MVIQIFTVFYLSCTLRLRPCLDKRAAQHIIDSTPDSFSRICVKKW